MSKSARFSSDSFDLDRGGRVLLLPQLPIKRMDRIMRPIKFHNIIVRILHIRRDGLSPAHDEPFFPRTWFASGRADSCVLLGFVGCDADQLRVGQFAIPVVGCARGRRGRRRGLFRLLFLIRHWGNCHLFWGSECFISGTGAFGWGWFRC